MPARETSVDSAEVAKFESMAEQWWDPDGDFRPLHRMTPCRLDYICRQIAGEFGRDTRDTVPFAGLRILDIGCGGGLLAEPLTRLGATVVGADAAEGNIAAARAHAQSMGLEIDYRHTTAEALADAGDRFDVVIASEVIEHVADPPAFLETCGQLVTRPGLLIVTTLNRTAKSYALAIVAAERILRWLPPGTHDWNRFLTPEELSAQIAGAGLEVVDRKGMVMQPFSGDWSLSASDLSVNYVVTATPPRGDQ